MYSVLSSASDLFFFSGFRQLDQSISVRLWPEISQSTEQISPANPDQTYQLTMFPVRIYSQVAQARNMSIGGHRHCYVTIEI